MMNLQWSQYQTAKPCNAPTSGPQAATNATNGWSACELGAGTVHGACFALVPVCGLEARTFYGHDDPSLARLPTLQMRAGAAHDYRGQMNLQANHRLLT